MRRIRDALSRTWFRRFCAAIALFAYVTATIGFPLPARGGKDLSQPFPCQDHPCGCQNAEQCWRHCCCFTPEEKLAWAEAHSVVPPDYAEQPAVAGWHTARQRDREADRTCGRCQCCEGGSCCETPARRSAPKRGDPVHTWVLGFAAARCHGSSTLWMSTGAVTPPAPSVTWSHTWPLAGWIPDFTSSASEVELDPVAPPPRSTGTSPCLLPV
jgi:hypothetical protein